MKPNEIKKYLYAAIVDFDDKYTEKDPSIISIIDELIDNINNSTEESSNNLNTVFQEIENRINTITREIETQKEVNVAFDNRIICVEEKRHWHENKLFLDTLTEDYIKSLVGEKEKYYKKSFLVNDWVSITQTPKYKLNIPESEHKMTTPYISDFFIFVDGVLKEALPEMRIVYPNTVRIQTYYPADGFVIIKDKES